MAEAFTPKGRYRKSKVARMYNFCQNDLRKFLNEEIFKDIEPLGYTKNSHYITARVMQVIVDRLGEPAT